MVTRAATKPAGLVMNQAADLKKESVRFKEKPFTFKLSEQKVSSRKKHPGKPFASVACMFCGSVKILGDSNRRAYAKSGRAFCDEDCACGWKSIYYASPNHKPFEESRRRTRARKAVESEQIKKRKEEREIARMLRPINAKTPGYYTCVVCKKTEWVDQHSQKKYCSDRCRRKSDKAINQKRNRRHKTRSRAISQLISLAELMRKFKGRCNYCKTLCVKPDGRNDPSEATVDHIMPLSKGGLHLWNNVQLLCRRCNTAKKDKVLPGTQLMLRFE